MKEIINEFLKNACPNIHKSRMIAVKECVASLCNGVDLATTSIGRNIQNGALPQSNIIKVDSLLSNARFFQDGLSFYRAIAGYIASNPTPTV